MYRVQLAFLNREKNEGKNDKNCILYHIPAFVSRDFSAIKRELQNVCEGWIINYRKKKSVKCVGWFKNESESKSSLDLRKCLRICLLYVCDFHNHFCI